MVETGRRVALVERARGLTLNAPLNGALLMRTCWQ